MRMSTNLVTEQKSFMKTRKVAVHWTARMLDLTLATALVFRPAIRGPIIAVRPPPRPLATENSRVLDHVVGFAASAYVGSSSKASLDPDPRLAKDYENRARFAVA
jgi:hypothetical protein